MLALVIARHVDYHNSDFFTFWLAGHMIWSGQNPYAAHDWISAHQQFGVTWIPNERFVYPLPLAFFYAPLGRLSLHDAYVTFVFLSQMALWIAICILLSREPSLTDRRYLLPFVASIALFRPVWITLRNGQMGAWLLVILVGVIQLWRNKRWFWGGMLLALVGLKPNLGIPIIALVSLWLWRQGRKKALAGILIAGGGLMLLGMLWLPSWIVDYWAIGNTKMNQTFGYAASLWGLAFFLASFRYTTGMLLGWAFTLALAGGISWMLWKHHASLTESEVVSLAVGTALLITPYIWPYDQILLLILLVEILVEMKKRCYPYLAITTLPLLLDGLSIGLLWVALQIHKEVLSGLTSFVALGILLYKILYARTTEQTSSCTS